MGPPRAASFRGVPAEGASAPDPRLQGHCVDASPARRGASDLSSVCPDPRPGGPPRCGVSPRNTPSPDLGQPRQPLHTLRG